MVTLTGDHPMYFYDGTNGIRIHADGGCSIGGRSTSEQGCNHSKDLTEKEKEFKHKLVEFYRILHPKKFYELVIEGEKIRCYDCLINDLK